MIQKGIIAQVIDKYTYKVRIPKYDKIESATASTKTDDLSSGIVCTIPGVDIIYTVGDVVLVSFENDELSKPIILGLLYRENSNSDSDISVSNVDSSLSEIKNNLDKINSSGIYTHLRYSNDNGVTFTSLFSTSNYEYVLDGDIVCQPLFADDDIKGIPIDKRSKVINWSIIDDNNVDITDTIGIETIVFDENGNIIKKVTKEDKQYNITINNSSQISGQLYLNYKIYVTKEYLDTLHVLLTTDKEPFGVTEGTYLGLYISDNPVPSINTSDYQWFSFDNIIHTYLSDLDTTISIEINNKINSLRQDLDEKFITIYYKDVEWTQAEVDVYCQPGYSGMWSRDLAHGYTGEVKEGNVLYISVHNTGSSSGTGDDSYGRLEIRATEDAAPGEPVYGTVVFYDISGEFAVDALARFKSSLLDPDSDETLIYGSHIVTGSINADRITANTITIGQIDKNDFDTSSAILNENVKVGGRNLFLNTGTDASWEDIDLDIHNKAEYDFYRLRLPYPLVFEVGDLITISFNWSTTATSGSFSVARGNVSPYSWGTIVKVTGGAGESTNRVDITSTNTSGHFTITFLVTPDDFPHSISELPTIGGGTVGDSTLYYTDDDAYQGYLRICVDGIGFTDHNLTLSNVKAEKGNTATDWTPAPEDIEEDLVIINDSISTTNTTINSLSDDVTANAQNITNVSEAVSENAQELNTQSDYITTLQNQDVVINNNISNITNNVSIVNDKVETLRKGIIIDEEEPYVAVVSQNGYVKVTDTKVTIRGSGQYAWADAESFNSQRLVSSDIRPRYMIFNDDGTVSTTGKFAISGRSNGHLSIMKTT